MEYWQYLQTNPEIDLQGFTEGLASHLSELLARGHSVADLISHFGGDFGHLPPERLRALVQAHRSWQIWRRRKSKLEQVRRQAKLPTIPGQAFAAATTPDQLDAVLRTARLDAPEAFESSAAWCAALSAGVELWSRCLARARKEGRLQSQAVAFDHPQAAEYDPYVKLDQTLEEIAPHRWLAMRRGERAGVLKLSLVLPQEGLLEEVQLFQGRLGPSAAKRRAESLLQELILDDLEPWIWRLLDQQAQTQAIKAASESFAGLLRSPPLQGRQVAAVYLVKPRAPVAVVIVDREGDLLDQRTFRADSNWEEKVIGFIKEQNLQQVVVPTSIPTAELLASLETQLTEAGLQLSKIRSAALAEARLPLTDPPSRLSPTVASALVLARRALDPLKEWSLVDPVSVGIAEYQNDLSSEQLRAALQETAELCRLERRRGKRLYMGGASPRGSTAMARLNPLVKTIADLRAGMTVHGVVTNISHFGAFINVGLPQEGLVHISELSDSFVANPNEVVSIGQQVTAQVLAVDPPRGRISLSLKTRRPVSLPSSNGRGLQAELRQGRGAPTLTKAQALANLEKLFKK